MPQRSTSTVGVNQRRRQPPPACRRNAVSERFISRAVSCIHCGEAGRFSRQTAAGLPVKGNRTTDDAPFPSVSMLPFFFSRE